MSYFAILPIVMTTQTLVKKLNKEVEQLKIKIRFLGTLKRFETLAEKGKKFARKRGIRRSDVLIND